MAERYHQMFQTRKASRVNLTVPRPELLAAQSVISSISELDTNLPDIIDAVKPSVVYIVGSHAAGSGIILTEDGDILTNAHVVNDNEQLEVELWNGEAYSAYIQYIDIFSDIAMIKIKANKLIPAKFASKEEILNGKLVLAIGSPELFRESVTMGIISGLGRGLDGIYPYHLIQTDAVINHGNSGGPLVNLKGEVLGINTFGLGSQNGIEVMNFAIPIDTVSYILSHFYRYGAVRRPYLGAMILENDQRSAGNSEGALVLEVMKHTSAQTAGIERGDIILEMDGIKVSGNPIDFYENLKHYLPGDELTLNIERSGKRISLKLVLSAYEMDHMLTQTICITKQAV